MRAVVYERYGTPDGLRLADTPVPRPRAGEVLVAVRAVSLNGSDWEGLTGSPGYSRIGGLFRPRRKVLGSDIAGVVTAVGPGVARLKVGDEVFGDILTHMGGLAEFAVAAEKALALKPAGLGFAEAAALPQAGVIALQGVRKGGAAPGRTVLINGGGGSAGSFAIQFAKRAGAEVTAVDNGGKLEFMRGLGATHVIDYEREDFADGRRQWDLILDVFARRRPRDYARALKPGGTYFFVGGLVRTIFRLLLQGPLVARDGRRLRMLMVTPNLEDLMEVAGMVLSGAVRPAIERTYTLTEAPDAFRHLGARRSLGKLVVVM